MKKSQCLRQLGLFWIIIACAGVVLVINSPVSARQDDDSMARRTVYICPPCGCEHDDEEFGEEGACPSCGMVLTERDAMRNVAIVIWNGAEILDFAGPTEVFASARGPEGSFFNVYTVAATAEPILSQGVVTVVPQYTIENCPKPDIFVLPGGGTNSPLTNPKMIAWVKEVSEDAEVSMSVCTGAFVLAAAGLLDGKEATTFHNAIDGLRMIAPYTTVYENQRWVDNGSVLTTAGVSAGIDGALYLVSRLCGEDVAKGTALYMEYDWRPDEVSGRIASPGSEPHYTLGQKIIQRLLSEGADAAWEMYRPLLGTEEESELPGEAAINRLGYRYLATEDMETAIGIFIFNTKAHPEAFNTWDSLGEAYMIAGQREKAIGHYKKSLEMNPDNDGAREMLKKLEAD